MCNNLSKMNIVFKSMKEKRCSLDIENAMINGHLTEGFNMVRVAYQLFDG